MSKDVDHPAHYTSDPSGIECIQITRHRNFNIGNAIKHLWRNGLKAGSKSSLEKQIEDLEKARWYIADEIERLKSEAPITVSTKGEAIAPSGPITTGKPGPAFGTGSGVAAFGREMHDMHQARTLQTAQRIHVG